MAAPASFPDRFVQQTVNDAAAGYVAQSARAELLGQTGVAVTSLRPTGRALIAGQRVDVICSGSFLEAGASLRVCSVAPGRGGGGTAPLAAVQRLFHHIVRQPLARTFHLLSPD